MNLTKTLTFDDDVLHIIDNMTWRQRGDAMAGVINEPLDRTLYVKVNKALTAMGGKWNRSAKAHLFPTDPLPHVDGLLNSGVLTVERDGYFTTPHDIGVQMARMAVLRPGIDVLEPSAGTGELAEAILEVEPMARLECGEKNIDRVQIVRDKGLSCINWDFVAYHFEDFNCYPRIIQNPPFENLQDIDHVLHAYNCLCPGGLLVSVMSESPFFRNDHKAQIFRQWLDTVEHEVMSLERGAFSSSGTGVKTRIVKIRKPY